jgi:energy-coupling factor transporter ATP-binding protein EcfA2
MDAKAEVPAINDAETLLDVRDLQTFFYTRDGIVKAVDGVSFALKQGEMLAIVGESGCGKSVTALSLLRLLPDPPGRIVGRLGHARWRRPARARRKGDAGRPRQGDLDDLPGADDVAQSGVDDRQADRGSAAAAPRGGGGNRATGHRDVCRA